ncbi:hypothetical protein [Actinoallomurus rhizosphaericola]|uniref:hypothetical protein n=1 Tax=Actinoallomurus rhizosphaericola TaxID=2952536 RepID=UPI002091074E|nr:hypothetical protein [Actinoallomurus rhizosphaericola]MCO5992687.1 hypothetical protein [Actinoallomurus rhizosphaericola]
MNAAGSRLAGRIVSGGEAGRAESWYHRLLRAYPPAYRAAHGEEIVGTLLEVSAGRARPSARECAGLVAGGLAARFRERTARSAPWWADGLALGAFLIALTNLASDLTMVDQDLWTAYGPWVICSVVLVLALLRGRLWVALPVALLEAYQVNRSLIGGDSVLRVVPEFGPVYGVGETVVQYGAMVAALVVLAVLATRRSVRPRPRSWWWLAVLAIVSVAWRVHITMGSQVVPVCSPEGACHPAHVPNEIPLFDLTRVGLTVLLLTCGVWATAVTRDLRWALAGAFFLLTSTGPHVYYALTGDGVPVTLVAVFWGVQAVLVGAMTVTARRGARARA